MTREKTREYEHKFFMKHPGYNYAKVKNWRKNNPGARRAERARRRAIELQAVPKWLSEEEKKAIRDFYKACPKGYHVDHILPLRGKDINGLHVLANLQYLSAEDNIKKSNKVQL